jgi:Flp pilus assembly protein protease CpaA
MVIGNLFLILLGLIWIVFAVVQDLKKREIANWLNFSLAIFALAFRLFYSLFEGQGFAFFFQGVLGFGIFFIIGNLLYYGKVFAGGDAKLMISLGAIIPFSESLSMNMGSILTFFLFFLVVGAFYGIVFGGILGLKNKKRFAKEFSKQFKHGKKIFYLSAILGIVLIALAFFEGIFLYLAILVFVAPYIYFSAKSLDESCMVRKIDVKYLTEGDWLYKNMKIGRRMIKAKWSGLSKEEILFLKKKRKNILIRQGIPFSPVFLISYLALMYSSIVQKFYLFY